MEPAKNAQAATDLSIWKLSVDGASNAHGVLCYKDRVCVPDCNDLRKSILEEAHSGED